MGILSIFFIAIGLAMDAFAVSLTMGFKVKNENKRLMAIKAGLFFGIAQGIMPVIGWILGNNFKAYIEGVDHWIAVILLGIIGMKMIYEGLSGEEEEEDTVYSNKKLFLFSIATSIDALAVGITFGALSVNIISAALIIALTTLVICIVGIYIGKAVGSLLQGKAEVIGGVILVLIGLKILVEHLGLLSFL